MYYTLNFSQPSAKYSKYQQREKQEILSAHDIKTRSDNMIWRTTSTPNMEEHVCNADVH